MPVIPKMLYPMWALPSSMAKQVARPSTPESSPSTPSSSTSPPQSNNAKFAAMVNMKFPVMVQGRQVPDQPYIPYSAQPTHTFPGYFDPQTVRAVYTLPPSNLRFARVDKMHAVHVRNIEGLYYPKDLVRNHLRNDPTRPRKAVLDIAPAVTYVSGGSAGHWAIDFGLEYPHVDVVGVDPFNMRPNRETPPNVRFTRDDYTVEMPQHHGRYDIVHARTIANGVKNYEAVIEELTRCLKPGGILLLCEQDLQLYDEFGEALDIALDDGHSRPPRYSWLARTFFETYNIFKMKGYQMDAAIMTESWLTKSPAFESVEIRNVYTPVGPWKTSANPTEQTRNIYIGTLMRENMMDFALTMRNVMIKERFDNLATDNQTLRVERELRNMNVHAQVRYVYSWSKKKRNYVDPLYGTTGVGIEEEEEEDYTYIEDSESSESSVDEEKEMEDEMLWTAIEEEEEAGDDEDSDEELQKKKEKRKMKELREAQGRTAQSSRARLRPIQRK